MYLEKIHTLQYVSNKSSVCTYYFWDQNPAGSCLLDTVHLLFLGKNPLRPFIKFGLFSQMFLDFSTKILQYFPNFSPFYANFIHFFHLVPLVNFGYTYTGKNYTMLLVHHVRLLKFGVFPPCVFIQYCAFIKIWGIFHPVHLFHPVLLLDSVEY